MIVKSKRLTFEQYLTYDDGTDKRYELEDGLLLEMPPATGKHEAIITFLLIRFYLEIQRLGLSLQVRPSGTEVKTIGDQSRRPDVCVITSAQADEIQNSTAVLQSPPPLVVEVVSPESVERDYQRKAIEYQTIGISEYWIVDPLENKVSVLLLVQGHYKITEFRGNQSLVSQTFPNLKLTAEQILSA